MNTHYERIGGEAGVRRLVNRFYDLMDEQADLNGIRTLHGASLDESREKLFLYLTGWMGGAPLYIEKHGPPQMRMRHMQFAIGEAERKQWMACMSQAMQDIGLEAALREELMQSFAKVAESIRNK
jgi:hemoglobin